LYYAYADALLDAGRADEARVWFGHAASADIDGETDADERVEELDGITVDDLARDQADDAADPSDEPADRPDGESGQ
jgi:hypothetical protein